MSDWDDNGDAMRRQGDSRAGGLRHAMDVPARIQTEMGGFIESTIRNVSSVGMYLHHFLLSEKRGVDLLPLGSTVTVVFAPDHQDKPGDTVKFSAQVMRRHPHGIGVRFLAVTPQHKRALRTLAVLAVGARESSTKSAVEAQERPAWKQRSKGIMKACRKVIEQRLPNMIWTLRIEIVRQLLLVQDDGKGSAEEARREAAVLEQKGTAIGRTIERRVIQSFAEVGGLEDTQEMVLTRMQKAMIKGTTTQDASVLVENKALRGSVAMRTTGQRLDAALTGKSFEINVRMANVVGRRIDNIENPLVPSVMCHMMWQSFTQFCDSARVHVFLHETMLRNIKPLLAEMYDELDQTLNEQGVPRAFGHKSAQSGPR